MVGIDGIAHLYVAGLEVCGGELSERFTGDQEVGGAICQAAGGEHRARFDFPRAVTFNQHESLIGGDRSDATNQRWCC